MKKRYFSFIGTCTAKEVAVIYEDRERKDYDDNTFYYEGAYGDGGLSKSGHVPQMLQPVHEVPYLNGGIKIYDSPNPRLVVIEEIKECEYQRATVYYLARRSSFDCAPFVPVSEYGQQISDALGY